MARMEPQEVQEFTKQMKEAGEASLTHVALTVSVLAVLVAMVTVLGHRTHTEAVLMQARATDQWNEYQAKKIRMDNLSVVLDTMDFEPLANADLAGAKRKEYAAHIEKWKADLAEEAEKAREFEHEVAHAEVQAGRFDLGEALLQIAVVLASITLFTRKSAYFFLGLALGVVGLLFSASAFFVR
jgi:hypothetical protein